MPIFAKVPEGVDNVHLTPGQLVPVVSAGDDGKAFYTVIGPERWAFCLWEGCAHLSPSGILNWDRVDQDDEQ